MIVTAGQRKAEKAAREAKLASELAKAPKELRTDCVILRLATEHKAFIDEEVNKLRAEHIVRGSGSTAQELEESLRIAKKRGVVAANNYLREEARKRRLNVLGSNRAPTRTAFVTHLLQLGIEQYKKTAA